MKQKIDRATIEELSRGYYSDGKKCECLFCDFICNYGEVYRLDDRYYEAEKYLQLHITKEHG